jgi:RNA polymerase sigma-70 factor, ECF subfamily
MQGRKRRLEDRALVSLVKDGDADAFAELYDRHVEGAYSIAFRMMSERFAAEDLLQEVFLSVWLAAESYRAERGTVRTWILSMVRNRGVDQIRYREALHIPDHFSSCGPLRGYSVDYMR